MQYNKELVSRELGRISKSSILDLRPPRYSHIEELDHHRKFGKKNRVGTLKHDHDFTFDRFLSTV